MVIFAVVILTGDDDDEGTAPAPDVTISEEAAGTPWDESSLDALVRRVT